MRIFFAMSMLAGVTLILLTAPDGSVRPWPAGDASAYVADSCPPSRPHQAGALRPVPFGRLRQAAQA
jgi:hypothetical protein